VVRWYEHVCGWLGVAGVVSKRAMPMMRVVIGGHARWLVGRYGKVGGWVGGWGATQLGAQQRRQKAMVARCNGGGDDQGCRCVDERMHVRVL
jgi:hypothetical protein